MGAGVSQCAGNKEVTEEDIKKLFSLEFLEDEDKESGVNEEYRNQFKSGALSKHSIIRDSDPDRDKVKKYFEEYVEGNVFEDERTDKAMGCFIGNVIGDALGAPFEFLSVRYGIKQMKDGFSESEIWRSGRGNSFNLKVGQWTDDASMCLCIADSLLVCNGFNAIDLRLRFLLWWSMGYCNAFGWDEERSLKSSVGLGGNISLAMKEFQQQPKKTPETKEGDIYTSGNGSLMRNAPVPVFYSNDPILADEISSRQSKTTHQGIEAAECCRLLTHIVIKAFNGESKESVLNNLGKTFQTTSYSVTCLANSKCEEANESNQKLKLEDRQWNWMDANFKYSENRATEQPGYIGSYCMDCLSMALHCIWTTDSFTEALLKCANLRGDSDSVCTVVGQIAGAFYGLKSIKKDWIEAILHWDPNYNIPTRAYKLYTHHPL